MPEQTEELKPIELTDEAAEEIVGLGLMMDRQLRRLTRCEAQRFMRSFSKEFGDEQGLFEPSTSNSCSILGMLDTAKALTCWLTEHLYNYETQTFDEDRIAAMTTARKARAGISDLSAAIDDIQRELRRLIVNHKMRGQNIEYINHLNALIEAAVEEVEEKNEGE